MSGSGWLGICRGRSGIPAVAGLTTGFLWKPYPGLSARAFRGVTSRWSKAGVWDRLFAAMADSPDFEYVLIDSTIVRAHQHAAGKKGGLKLAR